MNFKIFKVNLLSNSSKHRIIIHSFKNSFIKCQNRSICMTNSSELTSFKLNNSFVLEFDFLLSYGHYMASFVLYEAFETVTNSQECVPPRTIK